ncbi:hypothetical protein BW737_015365 [Actinomyces ruminis]|uniref:Uncharacterized protein n=1 Tax=Actinomyces ruminis TaxID=1937003 RepID=A0ABX4M868_9ACTO|nr:hypothetical protein BW737_015365 [Actinomyces ruminis]
MVFSCLSADVGQQFGHDVHGLLGGSRAVQAVFWVKQGDDQYEAVPEPDSVHIVLRADLHYPEVGVALQFGDVEFWMPFSVSAAMVSSVHL